MMDRTTPTDRDTRAQLLRSAWHGKHAPPMDWALLGEDAQDDWRRAADIVAGWLKAERRQALETAARCCDGHSNLVAGAYSIAQSIRALKVKPAELAL